MDQRTHLFHVPVEECLTKGTRKTGAELNARIDRLLEIRALDDTYRDKLTDTPVESIDADAVFQADVPAHTRFRELQDELAVRRDIAAYLDVRVSDLRAAEAVADAALTDTEAKVRAGLVSIGFVDTGAAFNSQVPGSIAPGWIRNHPAVRAAREHTMEVRGKAVDRSMHQANESAIEAVVRQLHAMRQKAVAAN